MDDGYNDDYPLLDFVISDDPDTSGIYAEDQVVWGPDGPELATIESSWDNDDDDDFYDEPFLQYQSEGDKEEEEFYVLEPKDLSCCYEEWEDYC